MEKFKIDLIFHLAASTHVDRSFIYPEEFLKANVYGTFNLLEVLRKLKNKPLLIYMGTDEVFGDVPKGYCKEDDIRRPRNPYSASKASAEMYCNTYYHSFKIPIIITRCYDENTRVLTENGLKKFSDLEIGDKVWVRKKGNLELEPIKEIMINYYEGEMIHFKTGTIDFLVTPNHRVLCRSRRKIQEDFYFKLAKEFKEIGQSSRYYLPKTGIWNCEDKEIVDMGDFISFNKVHSNAKLLKKYVKTETLLSLLGWYISKGRCNEKGQIEIVNRNPKYRKEIMKLIKNLGLIAKDTQEKIEINSVMLSRFLLKECGHLAKNKKIPKWALAFSPKYLKYLYNSLMKGDGSKNRTLNTEVYHTKSEKLVDSMIELILKLGLSPRISVRETWNPKKTKRNKSFIVRIIKHNKGSIEGKNIHSEIYKGLIWCLRVPSGNFFIERNGCIINSGNSMNMFGPYQHPEKLIAKIITRCLTDTHFTLYKGGSVRGWTFVKDSCEALDIISSKGKVGEIYHIPPDAYLTVPEVAKKILKTTEKEEIFDGYKGRRLKDDERYALEGSKVMYELKWMPPTSFEEGIKETIKWFKNNKWFWRGKE